MPRWFAVPALLLSLLPVLAFWWWEGRPVAIADAPSAEVPCASYAPYRDGQTPFDEDQVIPREQIASDLALLRKVTSCVRTYTVAQGLDVVPAIAREFGMKVMLGAWIRLQRPKNEKEIADVIALANDYPDTVKAVIVGNEVLLRREQPPAELAAMIARVRAAVPMPVTYADVWEFWQKYPEVADAVDFVTIHVLPYWEDIPRPIGEAVPHVVNIWRQTGAEFAGKKVFIGEAGWPSAGRMRDGARPGRLEQARFVRELLVTAERDGIGVNIIEAIDQPWKRRLEGTVGGHWGLLDTDRRPKFPLQGPVSAEPDWLQLFVLSAGLAAVLLLPALRRGAGVGASGWLALALAAAVAGTLLAQGIADGLDASRSLWDWLVFAVRVGAAAATATLVLETLAAGRITPPLPISDLLAAARGRHLPAAPWREAALGSLRAITLFGAAATTLCLVFDARYRDFTTAVHAVPALAFLLLSLAARRRRDGAAPAAPASDLAEERLLATVLAAGGIAVAVLEGFANHQALAWSATALLFALAVALDRGGAPALVRYRRSSAIAPSSTPPAAGSGP